MMKEAFEKIEGLFVFIDCRGDVVTEIIYVFPEREYVFEEKCEVRWLGSGDYAVFAEHLALCGQRVIDRELWQKICDEGTVYCLLYADGRPVARACVEKYSAAYWEVADVRVAREWRNRGYGMAVCARVLERITKNGKCATIRTEEDNLPMQRVIEKLGFVVKG